MFFLVERSGIKFRSKDLRLGHELLPGGAERICNQLHNGAGDGNLQVVLVEKNIHGANNGADDETNCPGTDCIDILGRIIGRFDLSSRLVLRSDVRDAE